MDILTAIDKAIADADEAKAMCRQALERLDKDQQRLDRLAADALAKYKSL